jgi:hypothetical protein
MRIAAAIFLLSLTATGAGAVEWKDLIPCKPAATRWCDHAGGYTMVNLMRCGATLAAQQVSIGPRCREVLRKYGQLQ